MKKRYILFLTILLLFSCGKEKEKIDENNINQPYQKKMPIVEWQLLQFTNWHQELLSQGKLIAQKKAELRFKTSGLLQQLHVKNGQKVSKNTVLAILDTEEAMHNLHLAQTEWQKAKTERYIQLIERATNGDTASISIEKKAVVDLRTGYSSAQVRLEQAQYQLRQTKLIAPFSGKIANLFIQNYNYINPSEVFCLLVDDTQFYLDFNILESEAPQVKIAQKIVAVAMMLSEQEFSGKIIEINPVVDKNGMIQVRAILAGNSVLFDGMQMEISSRKTTENKIVVPKSAIVERSGKWVAFVAKNGLAKWKYVDIESENSKYFLISKGLDIGDTLIISNNFNLVHDSEIKLKL